MKSLYEKLVASGVPPEDAVDYIAKQINPATHVAPRPAVPDKGARINPMSQQRVVAHVLLQTAYRALKGNPERHKVVFSVGDLNKEIARVYREEYDMESSLPTEATLQTLLSILRNEPGLSDLPNLVSEGPLLRIYGPDNIKQLVIHLAPRSAEEDLKYGLLGDSVPNWVIPKEA